MPWTDAELLEMQQADQYIERTFEKYEAYSKEQLRLDCWLDRMALSHCTKSNYSCSQQKHENYYEAHKAARIAYQKRYRRCNREIIALKRKATRRAQRRYKNESVESYQE